MRWEAIAGGRGQGQLDSVVVVPFLRGRKGRKVDCLKFDGI